MSTPQTADKKVRLPAFRNATHVVAVASGLFYGFLVYYWRDSIPDLRYPSIVVWALVIAAVYTVAIRLAENYFKWEKGLYLLNLGWIPLYIAIVYGTGGAKSPFLFLLLFPVITTSFNLDSKITKRVAFFMFSSAALMILADQEYLRFPGFIVQYFLVISALGIVMFYIYRLLSGTLLQKYEKEEAKKKYDELLEIDRLKTDFVTVISHQLRTPLTGAKWGLQSLSENTNIPQGAKSFISQTQEKIDDSISIVNRIVNSLDFESGNLKKEESGISLDTLVKRVSDKLAYVANKNLVTLKIDLIPCKTAGNSEMLSAAFSNIIDNALRYSPGGNVNVRVFPDGEQSLIEVKDDGIGISEEDLPYMFDRFYRGKNAIKIDPNGSGIGLYISKRIIERHGGTIDISSARGKGTKIAISLPGESEQREKITAPSGK